MNVGETQGLNIKAEFNAKIFAINYQARPINYPQGEVKKISH